MHTYYEWLESKLVLSEISKYINLNDFKSLKSFIMYHPEFIEYIDKNKYPDLYEECKLLIL